MIIQGISRCSISFSIQCSMNFRFEFHRRPLIPPPPSTSVQQARESGHRWPLPRRSRSQFAFSGSHSACRVQRSPHTQEDLCRSIQKFYELITLRLSKFGQLLNCSPKSGFLLDALLFFVLPALRQTTVVAKTEIAFKIQNLLSINPQEN